MDLVRDAFGFACRSQYGIVFIFAGLGRKHHKGTGLGTMVPLKLGGQAVEKGALARIRRGRDESGGTGLAPGVQSEWWLTGALDFARRMLLGLTTATSFLLMLVGTAGLPPLSLFIFTTFSYSI